MRLLACAVMLVFVPTVAAQMPAASMDMEVDLELLEADAGDVFNATVDVIVHCPNAAYASHGDAVVELSINAAPGLSIAGPQSRSLQALSCVDFSTHVLHFPMQIFVADEAYGMHEMHFRASMHTSNQQLSPAPDDVDVRKALKVHGEAPVEAEAAAADLVPQDDSLEEQAPGPALPVLAAGLLALARRRQA